jgi:hypothetical protein
MGGEVAAVDPSLLVSLVVSNTTTGCMDVDGVLTPVMASLCQTVEFIAPVFGAEDAGGTEFSLESSSLVEEPRSLIQDAADIPEAR